MPTYDYACECGHRWEMEQRITDEPAKACPECGEPKARRQVGAPSFVLKGGGWAADNYSRKL